MNIFLDKASGMPVKSKSQSMATVYAIVGFFLVLIVCLLCHFLFLEMLWLKHKVIVHTILEVICINVAVSTFVLLCCSYETRTAYMHILGFGFLAVAIFDLCHTIYFNDVIFSGSGYADLSTKFWITARLAEAAMLFASITVSMSRRIRKRIILMLTLVLSVGFSIWLSSYYTLFPAFNIGGEDTCVKVLLELLVVLIHLISLFNIFRRKDERFSPYNFIVMAILTMIAAEMCFFANNFFPGIKGFGHLLKVFCYLFLFRVIFVNSVTEPYQRLRDLHLQMNTAFDEMPFALLLFDLTGRVYFVNNKAREILQFEKEELLGLTLPAIASKFGIPGEAEIFDLPINDFTTRKASTKNGSEITILIKKSEVHNGFALFIDLASKEQELVNLQLQTQTILNSISNMIMMVDRDRRVVMCNRRFEEITEINIEDIIGKRVDELYDTEFFPDRELLDLIYYGNDSSKEITFTTMGGVQKDLLVHTASVYNIDGEKVGAIGTASDITDLKAQQNVIIQQEKLALLGQMGASIVHETKNFLTTIKGASQLLSLIVKGDQEKTLARKIDEATEEVNRIITDFLMLSKPKPAKFEPRLFYHLIRSIEKVLETSTIMQGVDIKFDFAENEKMVLCDESQIKQVVLNIAKNAVEAMRGIPNPLLSIRTYPDEEKKAMTIAISDNGSGIPPEIKERLGTPFFTTKERGTGLGLSVCFQIIRNHGGDIVIESEVGKGSTFKIWLPYAEGRLEQK